jgi:DNA-binding MarR family transcriptional regulator
VTHRLLSLIDEQLAGLGLSSAEIHVLACFAHTEHPIVRELSDATAQPPSTLTGVLDRLERRALIERRPNPADRRSTLITLTPPGRAAARDVAQAFAAIEARFPRRAAGQMAELLEVVEHTLEEAHRSPPEPRSR